MAKDVRDPDGLSLLGRSLATGGGIILGAALVVGMLAAGLRSCDFELGEITFGPGPGQESLRLPVEVEPRTGLTDGAVVTVASDAFGADDVVGVAVCLEEADTAARGVEACDDIQGARYAVRPDGRLSATYPVPRVITIAGVTHDCAARDTSCLVVAADANDYDVSGGQAVSFRTDLGPADMSPRYLRPESDLLPVIPPSAGPVTPGGPVEVTASGFQPDEPVLMAHCVRFPTEGVAGCDPVDDSVAVSTVFSRTTEGVRDRADGTGTVTFTFHALGEITPYANPFAPADDDRDRQATACNSPEAGCAFVIAAAADTKRSAVVEYAVAR